MELTRITMLGVYLLSSAIFHPFSGLYQSTVKYCKVLWSGTEWSYPRAPRTQAFNTYLSQAYGSVNVSDPYQWMEHDSFKRRAWVDGKFSFFRPPLVSIFITV